MSRKVRKMSKRLVFMNISSKRPHANLAINVTGKDDDAQMRRADNAVRTRCFICLENKGILRKSGRYVCEKCNEMWWHE